MTFELDIQLWHVFASIAVVVYMVVAWTVARVHRFVSDSLIRGWLTGLFWPIGVVVEICKAIADDLKSW